MKLKNFILRTTRFLELVSWSPGIGPLNFFLPPAYVVRKVLFSQASVCLSTRIGVPHLHPHPIILPLLPMSFLRGIRQSKMGWYARWGTPHGQGWGTPQILQQREYLLRGRAVYLLSSRRRTFLFSIYFE